MIKIRNYINVKLNDIEFKAKYNPEKIRFEYKLSENLLFVLHCVEVIGVKVVNVIDNGDLFFRIYYKSHQIVSGSVFPTNFKLDIKNNLFEHENYILEFKEILNEYIRGIKFEELDKELKKCFPKTIIKKRSDVLAEISKKQNLNNNFEINNIHREIKELSRKLDDIMDFLKVEKKLREKREADKAFR